MLLRERLWFADGGCCSEGTLYHEMGRDDKAVTHYKAALKLDPDLIRVPTTAEVIASIKAKGLRTASSENQCYLS